MKKQNKTKTFKNKKKKSQYRQKYKKGGVPPIPPPIKIPQLDLHHPIIIRTPSPESPGGSEDDTESPDQQNNTKIGEGSYGCIHKPSLHCNNKKNMDYTKKVSKIIENKHANIEFKEFEKISKIDKNAEYYVGKPRMCKPKNNNKTIKAINQCYNAQNIINNIKKYKLMIMNDGGLNLYDYVKKKKDIISETEMEIFLIEAHRLFKGLKLFYENNFVHFDVKQQNIVYNETANRLNFIDFGLSMTQNEVLSQCEEKKYNNVFYWAYPLESYFYNIHDFFYFAKNNNKFFKSYFETDVFENFIEKLLYKKNQKNKISTTNVVQKNKISTTNVVMTGISKINTPVSLKQSIIENQPIPALPPSSVQQQQNPPLPPPPPVQQNPSIFVKDIIENPIDIDITISIHALIASRGKNQTQITKDEYDFYLQKLDTIYLNQKSKLTDLGKVVNYVFDCLENNFSGGNFDFRGRYLKDLKTFFQMDLSSSLEEYPSFFEECLTKKPYKKFYLDYYNDRFFVDHKILMSQVVHQKIHQAYFQAINNDFIKSPMFKHFQDTHYNFLKMSLDRIDSYGLGLSLMFVVNSFSYLFKQNENFFGELLELFYQMINPILSNRSHIKNSIGKYEEILNKYILKKYKKKFVNHELVPDNSIVSITKTRKRKISSSSSDEKNNNKKKKVQQQTTFGTKYNTV